MSESDFSPEIASKEINISPIHLPMLEHKEMYKVSGQNEITNHSFERYLKDKEKLPKDIEKFNQEIENPFNNSPDFYKEKFKNASSNEKTEIGNKIFDLIVQNFGTGDVKTKIAWTELIHFVPSDQKKVKLINLGLNSDNIGIQTACADEIDCVHEYDENIKLRERVFGLMTQAFNGNNTEIQAIWADIIIYCAPEDKRNELKKRVSFLMYRAFNSKNVKTQIAWAKNIYSAHEDDVDRLKKMIPNLITQTFNSEKAIDDQIVWAKNIDLVAEKAYLTPNKRNELRKIVSNLMIQAFNSEDIESQIAWAKNIDLGHQDERKTLFKLAQTKKQLGKYLIEPPLYENKFISSENFSRTEFEKTGFDITLIGGNLKDKTIIRHVSPEVFTIWQKLYEDYKLWENKNFDYVPIEPIQSFKLNKGGLIDTYSGVLDLSLRSWENRSDDFSVELEEDRDKIIQTLKESGIEHGHAHDDNFCLRFFRDKNSNIDFSKKPRIYLIDFDLAGSSR